MRVRILGENAPYPSAGGATTGYLVSTGQGCFLIDCGSGVLSELLKHTTLQEVDAVVITHYHADHVADLGVLQYAIMVARKTGVRKHPLTVYANENPSDRFREVAYGNDVLAVPVNSKSTLQLCGATVTFADTNHAVPCLAVAVEEAGGKFVFSGDTGPSQVVEQFARNADLFLCEATWLERDRGPEVVGHLTAREAGEMAARANVRRLCLTHIYPGYDWEEIRTEAATVFKGEIAVAKKGMVITI